MLSLLQMWGFLGFFLITSTKPTGGPAWFYIKGRKGHLIYSSFPFRDNHDAFLLLRSNYRIAWFRLYRLQHSVPFSTSQLQHNVLRWLPLLNKIPSTCWRQRDLHVTMELHQKLRTFHMTECFLFSRSVKPSLASPHYTKLLEYPSISSGEIERQAGKKKKKKQGGWSQEALLGWTFQMTAHKGAEWQAGV